jgi:hypothetical protein
MTSSATGGRIGYFAPGGGFTHPNVFALGGGSQKMLDPDSPAYYGMPTGSPAWRMNIAKAKRAFILRAYVVRHPSQSPFHFQLYDPLCWCAISTDFWGFIVI